MLQSENTTATADRLLHGATRENEYGLMKIWEVMKNVSLVRSQTEEALHHE
ncbi:MAG TPA: hypothetical protein VI299_13360 [Polyangiales bacterium]